MRGKRRRAERRAKRLEVLGVPSPSGTDGAGRRRRDREVLVADGARRTGRRSAVAVAAAGM